MQIKKKHDNINITILKGIRLLFIPLSLIMYYYTTKAWNDAIGLVMAVVFGGSYFFMISNAIVEIICGEIKTGIEKLIRKATSSPVHIEFGKTWGRMTFLIFLQEDNETVTKVIYRKAVERLKGSEYFSKIQIVSMANVPNLEKDTIEKFKIIMLENAIDMANKKRREK